MDVGQVNRTLSDNLAKNPEEPTFYQVSGSLKFTKNLFKSVCINADLLSISLSFFDLNCFGGMCNCTIDKIGQMLLETVHYGQVEFVFTLLFSFMGMDLVASSKRSTYLPEGLPTNQQRRGPKRA